MRASARLRIPSLRRARGGRLSLSASDEASIGSTASSSTSSANWSPHISARKTPKKKQDNITSRSTPSPHSRSSSLSAATSKKRRVRFAPNHEDEEVTSQHEFEELQKQDIWYTRLELNEFKNETKALAEILEQDEGTGCIAVESESTSFRGLFTRQRHMERADSLAQCHLELSWQLDNNMGLNYFDRPANLLPQTQAACQQALLAGRQDEIEAYGISQ